MSNAEPAVRTAQVAYKLGDITYVPHYRNPGIFVGPGYPTHNKRRFTASELMQAGATSVTEFLWTRASHGIVNEINP